MSKTNPPHRKKFRFLLDSAFAHPQAFPRLAKKCNLAHTVHTFGLSPRVSDTEIYQKAIQDNRFVLTVNYKDFRRLAQKGKPGVIAIDSHLTNDSIDKLVSNFLSNKDPQDFLGKAIKI